MNVFLFSPPLPSIKGGKYYNTKNYIAGKDHPSTLEGNISNHEVAVMANSLNPSSTTSLPVYLTTPPLTPPRDKSLNEPPTNGNRNNVADCAHPKKDNFTTTSRPNDSKTVPLTNNVARFSEGSRQNGNPMYVASSYGDSEPPALIIVRGEGVGLRRSQEPEKGEKRECSAGDEDHFQESAWKHQRNAEKEETATVHSHHNAVASSTLQENCSISSSEDEEVEEMDLVLVEEEDEQEDSGKPRTEIRSVEAESSTSTFPQSTITSDNAGNAAIAPTQASCTTNRENDLSKTERLPAASRSPQVAHTTSNHVNSSNSGQDHHMRTTHVTIPAISMDVSGGNTKAVVRGEASQNGGDRFSGDVGKEKSKALSMVCIRQATKVKQVFTTIQETANRMGRDVAEQVQELIHAVMVR